MDAVHASAGVATAGRVFDGVVASEAALTQLRAAVRSPVHAYLLVGPPGSGKGDAALAFAAAVLCPEGGCGVCDVCARASSGAHPDVVVVEREGPYITVDQAREIQRLAVRTPSEATRKVLVLTDFHLVRSAAGTLLKIIEEPPESAIFVVLAEDVPPELVTIASRCVRIDFAAIRSDRLAAVLESEGIGRERARAVSEAADGRLDRARLLAVDEGFEARRRAWQSVPARLDGTGAAAAVVSAELTELLASAAAGPLGERHGAERAALAERIERTGERGAGRKQLDDRHKRELRRLRTDELRFGLSILTAAYRTALTSGGEAAAVVKAVDVLQSAAEALERNPNETLLLQSVLVRLPQSAA